MGRQSLSSLLFSLLKNKIRYSVTPILRDWLILCQDFYLKTAMMNVRCGLPNGYWAGDDGCTNKPLDSLAVKVVVFGLCDCQMMGLL